MKNTVYQSLRRSIASLACLAILFGVLPQGSFAGIIPTAEAQSAPCAIVIGNANQSSNTTILIGVQKYSANYVYSNCSYGSLRLVQLMGPSALSPSLPYTVPVNSGNFTLSNATTGSYSFQLQMTDVQGNLIATDTFGVTMTNTGGGAGTRTIFTDITQGNQVTCSNHRPIYVYDNATNTRIGTLNSGSDSVVSTSPSLRFEQAGGTITQSSYAGQNATEKGIMVGNTAGTYFSNSGFVTNNSSNVSTTLTGLPVGATTRVEVKPFILLPSPYNTRVCGSTTLDIYIPAPQPPSAPASANLTPSGANLGLSWSSVSGSGMTYGYIVEEDTGSGFQAQPEITTASTSATFTGVVAGATYRFRVKAISGGLSSAYTTSNTYQAPFATPTLSAFTVGSATPGAQTGWANSTTITYSIGGSNLGANAQYEIDDGSGFRSVSGNTGSFSLTGAGPSYTLSVRARNGATGTWSNVLASTPATIKVDTTAPTVTALAVSGQAIFGGDTPLNSIGCADPSLSDGSAGSGCFAREFLIEPLSETSACSTRTGQAWLTASGSPFTTMINSGSVCFRARDAAGNTGYSARTNVIIDRTAPTISNAALARNSTPLLSNGNTWYSTENADTTLSFDIADDQLAFFGADALKTCTVTVGGTAVTNTGNTCAIPGGDPTKRTVSIPASSISEGPNAISIQVTDQNDRPGTFALTLLRDLADPILSVSGLTENDPNYATSVRSDIVMSCADGAGSGCAPSSLQYLLASNLTGTCSDYDADTRWVTCADTGNCQLPAVQTISQLCVRAQDVAGRQTMSSLYTISVDTDLPTISAVSVTSGTPITAQNSVYYVRNTSATITFTPDDIGTGIDRCEIDGVAIACSAATPVSHDLTNLAEGAASLRLSVFDRAGNPRHVDLSLFVDTTPPSITGTFSALASETDRTMTLTLPTSFEDTDGSGVASLVIQVLQDGVPFTALTGNMITGTNPLISVDATTGSLIILRDTTEGAPAFPASVTLTGLPATIGGNQTTYSFTLRAVDIAQNEATATDTANVSGLAFDTIAPNMTLLRSTANGLGDNTSPYLVNSTQQLPLIITLLEGNNSVPLRSSTPVSLVLENGSGVSVNGSSVVCTTLLSDRTCTGTVTLQVPANFNGTAGFRLSDAGGNLSDPYTVSIKQDSDAPTWGPNGRIEAISSDGSALLPENTPFLSESFYFRAVDLQNDDAETQTFALVSFTNADGTLVTQRVSMTPGASGVYTFPVNLSGLPYGTSTISFIMEDAYGNQQPAGDTKTFTVFYDNRGPVINGFAYQFENNDAIVSFTSITEDSFPVRVAVASSTDGDTWTPRDDVQIGPFANAAAAANFTTRISEVLPGSQLRLEFTDASSGYVSNGTSFDTTGTTTSQFLMRDMLLSVAVDRANEQIQLSYVPQGGITNLTAYTVSFTGPSGRTGNFPAITTFDPAGGTVGAIDAPLMGTYTFSATLVKEDGSQQVTTRTFVLSEDILEPRATISLTPSANLNFNETDNTWYFNSDNPTLPFTYSFAPQQGSVYEESLPVTIDGNGATFDDPLSLPTLGSGNNTGTYNVDLVDDNIYNVTVSVTDNAAARNQVSYSFRIVKDRSNPDLRLIPRVAGTELTLFGSAPGEEAILQTKSDTVEIEALVDGELEPVEMTLTLDGNTIDTRAAVPTLGTAPYTQGFIYTLSNLADETVHPIVVTVRDRSGRMSTQQLQIRRDNQAPNISGTVAFATNASSNVNPVPLTAGLSVTDFTQVFYRIVEDGNMSDPFAFTGNAVTLSEGMHTALQLVFEDALGNRSALLNPLTNGETSYYIDTQIPTFTATMTPNVARTNAGNVVLALSNIVDASPKVRVLITRNNQNVVSEDLLETAYAAGKEYTVALDPEQDNTITVTLRDDANNDSAVQTFTIQHDSRGPEVTNVVGALAADNLSASWTFDVADQLDPSLQLVRVLYQDLTTGVVTSSTLDLSTAPNFTFEASSLRGGHEYRLVILAEDTLGNQTTLPTPSLTPAQNPLDALDPLENGPALDPSITGDTITVTISNTTRGGDINYVAENLPRGTHVILRDVLENGVNTTTNTQLTRLPAGEYTMTIVDNLGNEQVIDPFIVEPYYLDVTGDVNGDGFGGGISDHKILSAAEAAGNIYTNDAAVQDRLTSIKTVIETNIATRIATFLAN
ncbi:hypothetical protein COW46_02250 [Candidatus Gracilibacteria bacterium CG17_big_fil_post_rev_8_21_14_2_50_48_13]|nr:MAG: hypothetical protein COW46_02250 [Candidatus Gracilibacteria bacterium CG17_big_fil_post_rev_8_21_14_2_50_48_13]